MENNIQPNHDSDLQSESSNLEQRHEEKIIQPTTLQPSEPNPNTKPLASSPQLDVSNIYPEAKSDATNDKVMNASQNFALTAMQSKTKESNRLVALRVKSVLMIGVLLILSSCYSIFLGLSVKNGTFIFVVSGIQLLAAVGLLTSKDHHTVSLILKIFLLLQVIGIMLSLGNPSGFLISGMMLLLLIYAYYRVKSLSYY